MTVISGLAPHPSNNPLITSEAEHLRLLAQEISDKSIPIFQVAHLVAQYAHDKSLTNWHTALSRLGKLPEEIPPLPLTIKQIRNGICPMRGAFYLLPSGTLCEFEATARAYGQKHLAAFGGENPLQLRLFWNSTRQDHGHTPFEKYEWRWMSDDILEGSRNKTYQEQVQMVGKLGANFKIPSLREAIECLILHKVATEKSLLQRGNEQNGGLNTFTCVEEITQGSRMAIGGSTSSGVYFYYPYYYYAKENIGVVALRKFNEISDRYVTHKKRRRD